MTHSNVNRAKDTIITEDTPEQFPGSTTPYIVSKIGAMKLIETYSYDYGIQGISLRLPGVRGYGSRFVSFWRARYRPDIEEVRKRSYIFSIEKAKKDFGYAPRYSYEDAMKDYKKEMELGRFKHLISKQEEVLYRKCGKTLNEIILLGVAFSSLHPKKQGE